MLLNIQQHKGMETNVQWGKINSPSYNIFQSNVQLDNTVTLCVHVCVYSTHKN
jgi:hypothetical protein